MRGKSLLIGLAAGAVLAGVGAVLSLAGNERRAEIGPRDAVMIAFGGAETTIGDDAAPKAERPAFGMRVESFVLDRTPVTVAQFRRFADETGYVTEAETLGGAGVLSKAGWGEVAGANWRHPRGADQPAAADDHPVTQVSWNDAAAFCKAYGARLPTEFEWERAARLGQTADGTVFKAGTRLSIEGKFRANVWQGLFPVWDLGEDGFTGTSPVGAFGEAPSGLTDMAGNVWEWTASAFLPYPARAKERRKASGEMVQRGGSFLCDPNLCDGFRATARNHATPQTALVHVGFRCAADGVRAPKTAGRTSTRAGDQAA